MTSSLTKSEQETIITKAADESDWHVYTDIPSHARAFAKLASRAGISGEKQGSHGMVWDFPQHLVSVLKVRRKGGGGGFVKKRVPADVAGVPTA